MCDEYSNQTQKSSAFCRGRDSAKNSTSVQKGTSSNITLKVNFTVTPYVNFILMFKFNFSLTCYFDIFKGNIIQYEKQTKNF
jgi:hypothetical protein